MSSVSLPATSKLPPIDGVTLEQYGGITAALLDGFALSAVLQLERIDEAAWPRVSMRWSRRIAKDGAAGPAAVAHREVVAFARAWLGRRIAPLDDELPAWFGFLNAVAARAKDPDAPSLLSELRISEADVGRIQGAWATKIEQDKELAKQARELARAKVGAIPKLEIRLGTLRPFPWSRSAKDASAQATNERPKMISQSYLGDAIGMERFAGIRAELSRSSKNDTNAVLARHGLTKTELVALEARWKRRFDADPTLLQDFRALVRYYEARQSIGPARTVVVSITPPAAPMIGVPVTPPAALVSTALTLDVPRGPTLPFVAAQSELATQPAAKAPRVDPKLGETELALDVPRGPATPFEKKEAPKGASDLLGTSLLLDVPRALFEVPPSPPKPNSGLAATAMMLDVPAPSLRPPPAPEGAISVGRKLGELSMDLAAARDAALAAGSVAAPPMTLERHASMTVEIALAPEKALEVLARYGVSVEGKRAADAYWRGRMASDTSLRDTWNRLYSRYSAQLSGR
jgi:hypothetical protein